jgi:hypothetical protein
MHNIDSSASSPTDSWRSNLHDLIKEEKQHYFPSVMHPKTLALGVHKGGSTMLHAFLDLYANILSKSKSEEKINNLQLPRLLFQKLGVTDDDFDQEKLIPEIIQFFEYPVCFSGWRQVPMSFLSHKYFLSQIPAVCLIRDPRDCAVSAYFSFLNTHRLPNDTKSKAAQQILDERKVSKNMTIDEWVLVNAERFFNECSRVALFLHPNLRLYRYEDIWYHKQEFLQSVINDLGFPFSETIFLRSFEKINIQPGSDTRGHVRKGTPGDHREKLKESTRRQLFDQYQSVLSFFDYHY